MPPALSKKPATSRAIKTTTTTTTTTRARKAPRPTPAQAQAQEPEQDERGPEIDETEDEAYETAHEENNLERLFQQLNAESARKKDSGRKKRETRYRKDMAALRAGVREGTVGDEGAIRQRTKDAAVRLAKVLRQKSEVEREFMEAVEEMRQTYLRFNGELILTLKGRMENVEEVEVIDIEP